MSDGRSGSAARISGVSRPDGKHHIQCALFAGSAWHHRRGDSAAGGARELVRRDGDASAGSTDLPPSELGEGGPQLVVRAVQRELAARGFDGGPADGTANDKTKAAITAYQKAQGLPITGVATDELLRHILLGTPAQPAGATGSVAAKAAHADSNDASNVKVVQQVLADLGYAPGPVDGALGGATARAISAFQHDRKMPETGRISPELLRELKRVTGRDLTKMAAER